MQTNEKRERCVRILEEAASGGLCLAFSGGTDSSLLLKLSREVSGRNGNLLWAVTFDTVLHPACDLEVASRVAKELGVRHQVIHIDELQNPALAKNPPDRCYLCKKTLFEKLFAFAAEKGLGTVLEGTNEDDLHVYRPGLRAIREMGVLSPLAEAGLTKEEVRSWAAELGISVASRPASPCLATRLPYGTEIDLELLGRIGRCEEALRKRGFRNVRVRVHGNILRLETDPEAFGELLRQREEILQELRKTGPVYLTLDLEGFRSGSMDL
ncbi:MAG: ATP-dependent sacrificial sulfur transferase LarE [Candidatus Limivivens sp.]|nr:ATP-dependent sacrificial sulfur transferase LarE [Candidatus Limivivens sp.]